MPRAAKKTDKPNGAPAGKSKSAEHWDMFFETMTRLGGNVSRACELCDITRNAVYVAREKDPEFEKRFLLAKSRGIDAMEDEATRRAFEGVNEPVGFYMGVSQEVKTNYSDALLQFLLKANNPEKFKDRSSVETTDRTPRPFLGHDLSRLSKERLSQLRDILAEAKAPGTEEKK